ncbi:histidinol-phosphate aminotransferase [Rhodopseudomonas rhenobacensis]|uniref:Histidinol-phosphate aminotransferase n=1 Tax=Rhodopseudomonas rhenobacensis TaxID=87461 RepID=A0A7W7Z2R6_9BRAD|nr:histidinol-phosphate transaminase [Rhodopseudomonas rhenobacensis]MBB5046874.1 histidinol-phosphate aminotransferase [Rhodopseudomonas rhenobacensis]
MAMPTLHNGIRLSLNENPFGPSPRALQAIRNALTHLSSYAGDDLVDLKATIAELDNIAPEQIVLGEVLNVFGLYLAARGGPNGEFLYSEPGYTALVDAVAPAGGREIGIPLNDRLQNDLPSIAERVSDRTRAVYLVNPHNPTGLVEQKEEFLTFLRRLSQRTLVLVDEAYLDYLPDFRERTAARLVREGARIIVFRTFAKLHALAGLAFGYALAPPDIAAAMSQIGVGAFFNINRLSLVAANASLTDHAFIDTVRTQVEAERDAWQAMLRDHLVRFTDSQGNFIFFDTKRPQRLLAAEFAAMGIDIGRSHSPLETWARISIGLPETNAIARRVVANYLSSQ